MISIHIHDLACSTLGSGHAGLKLQRKKQATSQATHISDGKVNVKTITQLIKHDKVTELEKGRVASPGQGPGPVPSGGWIDGMDGH